jgi:hemolysin activation/secretion protein
VGDVDLAPYFLLPSLGSGETLRGFDVGRFRDRHSLLLTGEWRWMPNRSALDMALFVDAGKVAPRRSDLTLSGLKTDVGLGVRFHGATITAVRLEVARSREGWRAVVATSAPF